MRALVGAIIATGALIGLGLTALGIGTRYSHHTFFDSEGRVVTYLDYHHLDQSLMLILVVLLAALAIGLATAFIGLMYHHHRRIHEQLHTNSHPAPSRVTLP